MRVDFKSAINDLTGEAFFLISMIMPNNEGCCFYLLSWLLNLIGII